MNNGRMMVGYPSYLIFDNCRKMIGSIKDGEPEEAILIHI
jgi:hypothetical protein